jgi:hypothetical protein
MAWLIGIDEAGYGPNLGPFVMTAVACPVPDGPADTDLWQTLGEVVRRADDPEDERVLVADSKVVYAPAAGLAGLERGVLSLLWPSCQRPELLAELIDRLDTATGASRQDVVGEPWYQGTSPLPAAATADLLETAEQLHQRAAAPTRTCFGAIQARSAVVCPARFNEVLERIGSKAAVPAVTLSDLLGWQPAGADAPESLTYCIDKQGGRNYYAAMLQHAMPGGMVVADEEGAARSRYRVLGLPREVRVTFEPRADANHFCVALASMVSKYVRELLMAEFNRFWQGHMPDLKPTAGYPGDAVRFFEAIRPAARKLRIPEHALWRKK